MTSSKTFWWGIGGVAFLGILLLAVFMTRSLGSSTSAYQVMPMMGSLEKSESFGMGGANMYAVRDMAIAPSIMPDSPVPSAPSEAVARKEIKTGSLSMVVDDVFAGVDQITGVMNAQQGYVVSTYISKETRFPSATVSIRVPAAKFDASMTELKKLGEVHSIQVVGTDVTEEYVDLEARLQNLRVTEQQFMEIMKKATKIEDILAVQAQLSQVRGEIESLQGRKKYLDQNVEYSMISLNLSTSVDQLPVVDEGDEWKPRGVLKDALRDLFEVGKGILSAIIWILVFTPVWLILGGIVFFVKKRLLK